MNIREKFEAWYLAEYYEGDKECGLEWLSTESCGGYRYAEPAESWKVWQASRQAIEIELPTDIGTFSPALEGFEEGINYAKAAIEAAGLKVKP